MAHTLDIAQLLGTGPRLKSDHDPTKVISSDPATILGNGIGSLSDILLKLPEEAIAAISAALTGLVDAGLDELKAWVPGLAQVVDIVEAIIGEIGNLADLSFWVGNLEKMLGLPDFGDLGFDPIAVVLNFVVTMIDPLGFFANLVSGLVPGLQIPGLDASKIISGVMDLANLPSTVLNSITGVAGSLINSVLGGSFIPGLDASKIISGSFSISQITGLAAALVHTASDVIDQIVNTLTGGSGSGFSLANLASALAAFPTSLLSGVIGTGLIPGLDASKIVSGVFALASLPTTVLNSISGVAGSLINSVLGASLIPGLDASKIVTGIFNLTQLPSTVLNSITGVAGSLINSVLGASFIPGLDASKITSGIFALASLPTTVLNSIAGVAGSLINSIIGGSFIPGLDASKITSGSFAQSIITDLGTRLGGLDTGIQGAVDGIVNGLLGLGSIGWGQGDANAALAAQAAATAANAAAIAALQSNANQGSNGGQSFFHDFTLDSNGALPGDFAITYAGAATTISYGVAGGQSDWSGTPPTASQYRTADILYGKVSDSDYQLIGAVLTSTPGRGYIDYGAYPFSPHSYSQVRVPNSIRGRENAAGDTYIEAMFGMDDATAPGASLAPNNQLQLACVVSGSRTNWVTTTYTPKANTAYYLQCGTSGGLRIYRILEGAALTPILTFSEVGTTSQVGASYRQAGAFVKSNNSAGNGVAKSSPMSAFLLRDNLPATFIGSVGRAYRSTTTATRAYNTTIPTPAEFDPGTFDTMAFITPDLSYNQGANEVHTVTIPAGATSGTWTYTVNGQTLTGISRTVSTSSLQISIAALSGIGTGNVTVTGTAGTSYVITYGSALAAIPLTGSVTSSFNVGSASLARVIGGPAGFVVSQKRNYIVSINTTRSTSGSTQQPCVFVNGTLKRRGGIGDGRLQNTWTIPLEIGDRVSAGVATSASIGFQAQDTAGTDMVLEITGIPT